MMTNGFRKGQGATEYIVVLAIVLMVALVVVGLLGFFPSFSSGTQTNEASSYWQTQNPIAIMDAAQNSNVTLVLQNNAPTPLTVTQVNITGATSVQLGTAGAITIGNSTAVSIGAGGSATVVLINGTGSGLFTDPSCTGNAGKTASYNVTITYNSGSISGKKEVGVKPLVVNCQG